MNERSKIPGQQREQQPKDALLQQGEEKKAREAEAMANRYISDLQKMFLRMGRRSSLMHILPTVASQVSIGKCPATHLQHLLTRIRGQWKKLTDQERAMVMEIEASAEKKQDNR